MAGLLDIPVNGVGLLGHGLDKYAEHTTERGDPLVMVGNYKLSSTTKKKLGMMNLSQKHKLPWYQDRAYLEPEAAAKFMEMREAFGEDIPLESAYRNSRHNNVLPDSSTTSVHLEGLAIDVRDSKGRDWMMKHGEKYGWKLANYRKKDGSKNKSHFYFTGRVGKWT